MDATAPESARSPSNLTHERTQHRTTLLAQDSIAPEPDSASPPHFFSSAQWSADGTTILVGSSDYAVTAYVLPDDLLSPNEAGVRQLAPQSATRLPEPTQVIASSPFYSLNDPETQVFLVGCRDHPVQLYHAFANQDQPTPLGSYKLIRQETEAYITPSSLIWPWPGTHFICGSSNRLDYFDVTRAGGDGPVTTVPTIPSRRYIAKGNGVGMKGTVSALAASPPNASAGTVVAAGTWTRWIGLYDFMRTDTAVANWSIAKADQLDYNIDLGGQGIVQTIWSPCGRYLVLNERNSSGLLVYDIRGAGKLLSVLNGRTANSQQKLTCDVFQGGNDDTSGFEVWAGSQDGSLLVWDDVGFANGIVEPARKWEAHASPVGSTIIHSSGTVAATCSGGWGHSVKLVAEDEADVPSSNRNGTTIYEESSLKVWAVDNAEPAES